MSLLPARRSNQVFGDIVQKTRRRIDRVLPHKRAAERMQDVQPLFGPRNPDIEKSALFFQLVRVVNRTDVRQ